MVKMGICPECVFGTGEFGVGEHFRRRQVDRMVGWSSSSYLYLYLHSMVWYVRSLCGKHSVELCMAMEMGTRTRIRNQNLNASQMQLNLKWLESHKRGHLDIRNPAVCSSFFFLYVPDICNCYVYGIKFQKIFQTLPAFACDTLFSPIVLGIPLS